MCVLLRVHEERREVGSVWLVESPKQEHRGRIASRTPRTFLILPMVFATSLQQSAEWVEVDAIFRFSEL